VTVQPAEYEEPPDPTHEDDDPEQHGDYEHPLDVGVDGAGPSLVVEESE
jgi:hypothetical protein